MQEKILEIIYQIDQETSSRISTDGKWGSWSSFTACSATCGRGQMTRQRICNNPAPANNGSMCTGAARDSQNCRSKFCPGILIVDMSLLILRFVQVS